MQREKECARCKKIKGIHEFMKYTGKECKMCSVCRKVISEKVMEKRRKQGFSRRKDYLNIRFREPEGMPDGQQWVDHMQEQVNRALESETYPRLVRR